MAKQMSFQIEDGGSIPTSPLQLKIYPCHWGNISWLFKEYHYKSDNMGGDISYCFYHKYDGSIWGAAALGPPRHNNKYSENGKYKILDLRRLVCKDEAPKNTESYFLSKIIWWIKKYALADAILTYADETFGHKGIIYKAANFKFIGKTSVSKHIVYKDKMYHMRSLTIERPYSYKLRQAVKDGEAMIITGKPKNIFIYWIIKNEIV